VNDKQGARQANGETVAFIGFFSAGDVFVAWDPRHVFSLHAGTRASVYAREWQRNGVLASQVSVYQFSSQGLGKQSLAIALPAAMLGFYLENIPSFHSLGSEQALIALIAAGSDAFSEIGIGKRDIIEIDENGKREKFTFQRTAYPRDPRFSRAVLDAYDRACCICGRQLGVVQAAHIIPHSDSDSSDQVANGLALCIEHHRLYDDALLLPSPGRKIVFNERRAEYLRQIGQDKGLKEVRDYHEKPFKVPIDPSCAPSDQYLAIGLKRRLDQ
jgi:putative restriction endonuclease